MEVEADAEIPRTLMLLQELHIVAFGASWVRVKSSVGYD